MTMDTFAMWLGYAVMFILGAMFTVLMLFGTATVWKMRRITRQQRDGFKSWEMIDNGPP